MRKYGPLSDLVCILFRPSILDFRLPITCFFQIQLRSSIFVNVVNRSFKSTLKIRKKIRSIYIRNKRFWSTVCSQDIRGKEYFNQQTNQGFGREKDENCLDLCLSCIAFSFESGHLWYSILVIKMAVRF